MKRKMFVYKAALREPQSELYTFRFLIPNSYYSGMKRETTGIPIIGWVCNALKHPRDASPWPALLTRMKHVRMKSQSKTKTIHRL